MEYLLGIVLVILVFKFFSKHFFINNSPVIKNNFPRYQPVTVDNFILRPSLMNGNERLFFEQLKLAMGEQYDIYPQVSLSAIFRPKNNWKNWAEINKLNKRIDFILFDKNTQTPKIAIELDGYSHSQPKSFKRDEFVGQIFTKFNIPLVRFNNGTYSAAEISSKLINLS